MRSPVRPTSVLALAASGMALALVVAASGSSATPSPAASAAPAASQDAGAGAVATPAPSAEPSAAASQDGGGTTATGCADPAKLASSMQSADHYIATASISTPIPGASADASAPAISMEMKMEFAKPDKMRVSAGLGGGSGSLFEMVSVGGESWLRMFGADTWTKSETSASPSPSSNPDVFANLFDPSSIQPLDVVPAGIDLPGSSSCVVAYSIKTPPVVAGGSSNPLGDLGAATAFAARVDTSTGRPQSMAFILDSSKVTAGGPAAIVFAFDYDSPVEIAAPDPSKVGTGGFALPSGLVLPSGLKLP
jgi:hypothetical protein